MSWLLWLLLAALLVLPVLLRIHVGDEHPNEIRQEQPGPDDEGDPGGLLAAA